METIMEGFLELLITILAFSGGIIISAILLSSVHSERKEERHMLKNKEILIESYLQKLKRRRLVFFFISIASIISGSLLTLYFNGKADAHAGTFSGFGDAICVVLSFIQFSFVIVSCIIVLICNQNDIKRVRGIIKGGGVL